MAGEVKEAKVDLAPIPSFKCPHCGAEFKGWKIKYELEKGETINCDNCQGQIKLV